MTWKYDLYIDGKWDTGTSGRALTVVNPATEETIGTVPDASLDDIRRAIAAARTAFDEGPWPCMTPLERAAVIRRIAEVLQRRRSELVDLVRAETGSPQWIVEMLQVGVPLRVCADVADRVLPQFRFVEPMLPSFDLRPGQGIISKEPIGVAALITPFNFPLFLNVMKLAPALAAGCTVVLKPSPLTPLEALVLGEVADEVGLPPGVLNIVTGGAEESAELTTNPMVDLVSFTGSDTVGRQVMNQASATLKKVVLELGGKSANVIFADADLDAAAAHVVGEFTLHAGQGCSLLTRTLVEESIHDELVDRVNKQLAALKVGDPADPSVMMGPLISEAQRNRVEGYIKAGVDEGAEIAFGGGRPSHLERGYFVEPTLFTGVRNEMKIAQEEIFGPVGVVIPFTSEHEAVRLANDSDFGLGGGVWSTDVERALRVAQRIRTGMVAINGGGGSMGKTGPFGGFKASGLGREWGEWGLDEFLEMKQIIWPIAGG